jgi:hypothetical protein
MSSRDAYPRLAWNVPAMASRQGADSKPLAWRLLTLEASP